MIQQNYSVEALPMAELQQIGLIKDGKFNVTADVQEALLAGRRTSLLRFNNLQTDTFKIPQLDAKVSVRPREDGTLELLMHPIYKDSAYPPYLNDMDIDELKNGQSLSILKNIDDGKGGKKEVIVEYDAETNEFIATDISRLAIPEAVNNQPLSAEQKAKYKKGKEIEMPDGTILQYSELEKYNLRSNKLALVVSLLLDGGTSFFLLKGINYLFNKMPDEGGRVKLSENYKEALEDVRKQNSVPATTVTTYESSAQQRVRR